MAVRFRSLACAARYRDDSSAVSTIYVTGHRNPDTDAIASAIGYAELNRRLDPQNDFTSRYAWARDAVTYRVGQTV